MKPEAIVFCTRISAAKTAKDLEDEHLNQQIIDISRTARTLTKILIEGQGNEPLGKNEPVLRMWKGYEHALVVYGMLASMEFGQNRGYADDDFWRLRFVLDRIGGSYVPPPWQKDRNVMRSHRSNLVRLYPDDYEEVWPGTPENWPYIWPFTDGDGGYDLYVSKTEQKMLDSGERELPDEVMDLIVNL